MKKYLLLVFTALLFVSKTGSAQASLGISQYSYFILNDTVPAYSTDSISIFVVNRGVSSFSGNFTIKTAVKDSNSVATYHQVDSANTLFPVSIAVGDSVPFSLAPYYIMGDSSTQHHFDINVIVIWPVALTASTDDSLMFNIFIVLNVGVQEIDLTQLVKAYPNPTTDNLTLENTSQKAIEEVRIYDITGRIIQIEKNPSIICTDTWKAGTYMIKIQLENKQTRTIRVIKQ